MHAYKYTLCQDVNIDKSACVFKIAPSIKTWRLWNMIKELLNIKNDSGLVLC
jgi:hypothetical protein